MILSTYGDPFEWYEDIDSEDPLNVAGLSIVFKQEKPSLTFELHEKGKDKKIVFKPKNKESTIEYLKALNIFFILCKNSTILGDKHALRLLKIVK